MQLIFPVTSKKASPVKCWQNTGIWASPAMSQKAGMSRCTIGPTLHLEICQLHNSWHPQLLMSTSCAVGNLPTTQFLGPINQTWAAVQPRLRPGPNQATPKTVTHSKAYPYLSITHINTIYAGLWFCESKILQFWNKRIKNYSVEKSQNAQQSLTKTKDSTTPNLCLAEWTLGNRK